MAHLDLLRILDGKWEDGTRPRDLFAAHVAQDGAGYVPAILAGLRSASARVRNGCAELSSLLSGAQPALLYPAVDLFLANLDAREPVLRWEAACTIGNLAAVDLGGQLRPAVPKLAGMLSDKSIVLQGHAVRALAKLAGAHPDLAPGILRHLTGAVKHFPDTRVGYLVEAMAAFGADPKLAATARKFLAPYGDSELKPVATKARRALKSLGGR